MPRRRWPRGSEPWSSASRVLNTVPPSTPGSWLRRRLDMPLHDIAPMRVARRKDLLGLGVEDRRFGYPVELLQRAMAAGWRFAQVLT